MKRWNVTGTGGFEDLKLTDNAPIPEVGDSDVLVKCSFARCNLVKLQLDADATTVQAASLNFRDLQIVRREYMFPTSPNVVPASDGAGVVEAVGKKSLAFRPVTRSWSTSSKVSCTRR